MSICVDPGWWKTLFDEVYLLTDARSVCDESITRREVDVICDLLPMRNSHKILDLCGGHGRHSFELCKRGFTACTVFDYSRTLIEIAEKKASQTDFSVNFICGDARRTEIPSQTFDHVLILGNSLGYIQQTDADFKILAEAFRVLRQQGWILVDVTDGAAVRGAFKPNAWHEIGTETIVCRQREIQNGVIRAREIVLNKRQGLIRDQAYAIRLYDTDSLCALLDQTGFKQVKIHTNFAPHETDDDYGFMNNRMIAIGQKR